MHHVETKLILLPVGERDPDIGLVVATVFRCGLRDLAEPLVAPLLGVVPRVGNLDHRVVAGQPLGSLYNYFLNAAQNLNSFLLPRNHNRDDHWL
jgi:hypothetical protein